MKKVKTVIFYFLILSTLLSLGFYRDFVFKSINALLQAWDHDLEYTMPSSLNFFEKLEYETIVNLKWLLTLVFSLIYLIISIGVIRFIFDNRRYLYITIGSYLGVIIVSAIFIGIGMIFSGASEKMYEFARYLMGMAQSPIILMILIPAFKIYEKENSLQSGK